MTVIKYNLRKKLTKRFRKDSQVLILDPILGITIIFLKNQKPVLLLILKCLPSGTFSEKSNEQIKRRVQKS